LALGSITRYARPARLWRIGTEPLAHVRSGARTERVSRLMAMYLGFQALALVSRRVRGFDYGSGSQCARDAFTPFC
jgi:hypothetical protein